ncbi:MAG: DUF1553 domain-containing protein [Limisphaerales bacterium]
MHPPRCLAWLMLMLPVVGRPADEATFFRAINLNGPALVLDGHAWETGDATNLVVNGNAFENQAVPLKPPTDAARAKMIRSSRWGSKVDVELTAVPAGDYQVFLYVWQDNHDEQFDLLVNGKSVVGKFHSGSAGAWRKLGPWPATSADGRLKVSARGASHGAANLSGIEVWSGSGAIPQTDAPAFVTVPTEEQVAFFERRIRPALVEHCYDCHSAGAKKLKGGLVLDSRAGVVQGGDTGPVITPGEPDASLLIQAVRHADPNLAMPPKYKLPADMVADLEQWVRMGAPDPRAEDTVASARAKSAIDWDKAREWWSLRPVTDRLPPPVARSDWPANDLDRFILARQEAAGLTPAADAGRRVSIRRVTFDLTGLPPTPEEVDAFLADDSTEAFAKVVDRLLASPRYGERWGRHWLDVVRYADTAGDNSDFPIPQMHRYRDWVIGAFNRDLPYDQFVREQLAGDLLPAEDGGETDLRIIATGYIANARRFGSRVDDYPQHLTIEDTIDNVGRAFLGLTVSCARCHDHKFDPISTQDYYALYGIFHSTRYPWPGIELDQKQRDFVPLVPPGEMARAETRRKEFDAEKRRLEKAVQTLKDSLKDTPAEEKKDVEAKIKEAEQAVKGHVDRGLPFEQAYAVAEAAKFEDVPVQQKGDPAKPGVLVPRRFLTVLGGAELPKDAPTSGRLQLAGWIIDPANPLTARVMVNRIWLHHFGRGLVPTANDFGKQGKPPTHPELLDWLATRFRESGWSVKAMHRLILLSRTYRQSSQRSDIATERDPGNDLLSAFPRRRLDAEALRDTLLALGGNLDPRPGGEHPFPRPSEWKFTQHNPFRAVYPSSHRSVYLMTQRIQRHPFLAIFDGADPAASTPARLTSTTPLQALFFLNDELLHEQAQGLAGRLITAASDDGTRVSLAYQLALGREPDPAEAEAALRFVSAMNSRAGESGASEAEAWRSFSRALFRLNEFVYLD